MISQSLRALGRGLRSTQRVERSDSVNDASLLSLRKINMKMTAVYTYEITRSRGTANATHSRHETVDRSMTRCQHSASLHSIITNKIKNSNDKDS